MGFRLERWEPLADGDYEASVAMATLQPGRYGQQVRFDFGVHGTPETLVAWSTAKLSPRTRLGRWVTALLGELPEVLDSDELLGCCCVLRVGQRELSDGSPANTVLDVLPAKPEHTPEGLQGTMPLLTGFSHGIPG